MKNTFLITTLLATTALASNAWADCTNNQTCGDNCCWELTQNGGTSASPTYELTISGTGPMTNVEFYSEIPWFNKRGLITSVQVSNGITSIGRHAFQSAVRLTSITIPNSVTSIGRNAFYSATGLTSITIPNSVTSIGDRAFYGASSLTSITIPNSVTSIGVNAFEGATRLTDITIPDTAALGANLFKNLDLNNITIHCAGVLEQCKANMAAAGYANGTYNMEQAPYSKKQADGSRANYDANGKLTGFTGKRIYTVEDARQAVEAAGTETVNFRIRYK